MAVQSIGSGAGMMADILRCRPTYGENTPRAPETLIVKLPSSDPKSRSLGRRLNLYKRECDYYQHIAPLSPTRSPHLFHGGFDPATHRFVLVLEDLRGMTATDQETGATPEEAKQVIREIAKLHGHFLGQGRPTPHVHAVRSHPPEEQDDRPAGLPRLPPPDPPALRRIHPLPT